MLLFYIRIFSVSRWRTIVWLFVGLNVTSLMSIIISALAICRPIRYSYDKAIPGHCSDMLALQRYTAIWNLFMDVSVEVLPMTILWGLKLNLRKNIGLSVALGMGAIICLMTLTRVLMSAYYQLDNITRQNSVVVSITGMEPMVGIVNALHALLSSGSRANQQFTVIRSPQPTFQVATNTYIQRQYIKWQMAPRHSAEQFPESHGCISPAG